MPLNEFRKTSELVNTGELTHVVGLRDGVTSAQPLDLFFTGVPPITTDSIALTVVGGSSVVLTSGFGSGSIYPKELILVVNGANLNGLGVQNIDPAGWSSFKGHSSDEYEVFALGFGNPDVVSTSGFAGAVYLEATRLPIAGGAVLDCGPIIFSQFTTYGGAVALAHHHRLVITEIGDICINAYDDAYGGAGGPLKRVATFNRALPILRLGNGTGAFGYAEFQGGDANWSMVFREGGDAANGNSGYCYGGTLAAGGGWRLYTGGVRASQTPKLQIADDGTALRAPSAAPSTTTFQSVAFYLDESGGAASPVLKMKVVSSNGTIKTGTVTLS